MLKIEGEYWWKLYILRMNTYDRSIWHMIQVMKNQTICWELFVSSCSLQGGTLVSSTVHCTRTLDDGAKDSQGVAKLRVLSPKSCCESLFDLEIWRELEVLSDWEGTCRAFSQELLSNVYQNLENFRSDRRQLMLDVNMRDRYIGEIGRNKGQSKSPITVWKCESEISDHQDESRFLSTERGGNDSHLGQQVGIQRAFWSDPLETTLAW